MALRDLALSLGDSRQERAIERDVEAELAAHLALSAEALEAEGNPADEAQRLARERFGDIGRIRRQCLSVRLGGIHAMKKLLIASNVVLLLALVAALLMMRAQAVRTKDAMQQALAAEMLARAQAEAAAQQAELAARVPVERIVVEVGDEIETFDRHRRIDLGERAIVQPDGKVLLHDVGWIDVHGLSREEVEQRLTEAYKPFYEDLEINVIVHKRSTDAPDIRTLADHLAKYAGAVHREIIEVGDAISLRDPEGNVISATAVVQPDGRVLLEDVGWVAVAGLSIEALRQLLKNTPGSRSDGSEISIIVDKGTRSR